MRRRSSRNRRIRGFHRWAARALLAWLFAGVTLTGLSPAFAQALPGDAPPTASPTPDAPTAPTAPASPGAPGDPMTGGPASDAPPEGDGNGWSAPIKTLVLLTALTFIPAVILGMTSFTRIVIVLAMLRQAVGIVQLPPSRILVTLALFLTMFTMAPVFSEVWATSLEPYDNGELSEMEAAEKAMIPMRRFMLRHVREDDLALFINTMGEDRPKNASEVPTVALVPAFMLSELKTAFQMGSLLFLPFLAIELVVASILMSMGMMMLPPTTISLPLKVIVFVLVDGWGLVVHSLATSYGVS